MNLNVFPPKYTPKTYQTAHPVSRRFQTLIEILDFKISRLLLDEEISVCSKFLYLLGHIRFSFFFVICYFVYQSLTRSCINQPESYSESTGLQSVHITFYDAHPGVLWNRGAQALFSGEQANN